MDKNEPLEPIDINERCDQSERAFIGPIVHGRKCADWD
jgi:hypothetical protein